MFYDPLTEREAQPCLIDFYEKVCQALTELHQVLSRAHMDICLENIGFREHTFHVVLIDLERSVECTSTCGLVGNQYDSCMYSNTMTPEQHNWRQLGWLVAWVLDPEAQEYHTRVFVRLPEWLRTAGLYQLIEQGKCMHGHTHVQGNP